jgi:hypothetical protein
LRFDTELDVEEEVNGRSHRTDVFRIGGVTPKKDRQYSVSNKNRDIEWALYPDSPAVVVVELSEQAANLDNLVLANRLTETKPDGFDEIRPRFESPY